MKIKKFITIIFLFIGISLQAQQDSVYKFNISEAIDFAIKNNINVQNQELEIRKAKWKIWETTAIGLPQISASSEYQNFPNIPTQLIPNFLDPTSDVKMPVKFGSKHNLNYGLSVSQIIFSGEYIVGLQAAKTYKLISEQNYAKAKIELKSSVEQAYFLALISKQSREILEKNFSNILTLTEKTQKMVNQGLSNQTRADQITILQLNLKNQISSLKRQETLSMLMLKLQLGLMPEDSIILTSSLDQMKLDLKLTLTNEEFDINRNINYRIMNTQVKLKMLDLRRAQSQTLPQIGAYFSYSNKAMEDKFDFFDPATKWYPTTVWGVKLSIPLFASGMKYSTITQKKIELNESLNQQKLVSQQLNLQFEQAKNNYINALENLYNQEKNKTLSENIYNNTQLQFKEGTASSMDLTQAQNQYLQAEANYYQALLQVLNSKSSLEKILNQN